MRRVTAYPPTPDPLITGLCEHLTKCVNAKFYIKLDNQTGGSGFFAEGDTIEAAKVEARTHLRKYPTWGNSDSLPRLQVFGGRANHNH